VGRDREGEPHLHPTRVALDRRIEKGTNVRELDDLVEAALDLVTPQVEDGSVEEDVLAPGQLRMEARADL
jgi:hypothetical protein